jgi:hypothetical protein
MQAEDTDAPGGAPRGGEVRETGARRRASPPMPC